MNVSYSRPGVHPETGYYWDKVSGDRANAVFNSGHVAAHIANQENAAKAYRNLRESDPDSFYVLQQLAAEKQRQLLDDAQFHSNSPLSILGVAYKNLRNEMGDTVGHADAKGLRADHIPYVTNVLPGSPDYPSQGVTHSYLLGNPHAIYIAGNANVQDAAAREAAHYLMMDGRRDPMRKYGSPVSVSTPRVKATANNLAGAAIQKARELGYSENYLPTPDAASGGATTRDYLRRVTNDPTVTNAEQFITRYTDGYADRAAELARKRADMTILDKISEFLIGNRRDTSDD